MNSKKKAEEFFEAIITKKKCMFEIPKACSQGENGTLLYLSYVKNNITASDLSLILNVSMPRVVNLVNTLEQKGLISKRFDENDKRKTLISITEKGRNLINEKKTLAILNIAKVVEFLGEDDINEYIRISQKIEKIITENNLILR